MIPRLSVCIPTHDGRAEPLRRALASIVEQLDDVPPGAVEVVVSDNGSRDATRELVLEARRTHPDVVRYVRFEENRGFKANLLRVVGTARGEFCWLFSSDDAVAPGGLRRLMGLLEQHPDVTGLTIRPVAYDFEGDCEAAPFYPDFLPRAPGRVHRWTTVQETVDGCGLMMGLLPAQVVRRATWDVVASDVREAALDRFDLFPHYYLVLRMLVREPAWLWDPGPTFLLRTEVGNSVVADMGGDLTGYHLRTTAEIVALWQDVLGDGVVLQELLAKTRRTIFPAHAVVHYKVQPTQTLADDVRLLGRCVGWFWRMPAFWPSLPVLLLPHPVARILLRGLHAARGRRDEPVEPS